MLDGESFLNIIGEGGHERHYDIVLEHLGDTV